MQILGPNSTASAAFIVTAGKQVTLSAQGLSAGDEVIIEIVTLSSAPEFKGNPCCDLQKFNIEVTSAVPLKCPDGTPVTMTAEYPFVVLDGPQMVAMRARVDADPSATVIVDLNESDSDGCTVGACRPKAEPPAPIEIASLPCLDICSIPDLVISEIPDLVISEIPDLVISEIPDLVISEIPDLVISEIPDLVISEIPDLVIGEIPDLVISELPIVELKKQVVAAQVVCGELWYIWSDGTKTTETLPACPEPVVYCPSLRISCNGETGFGYHDADPPDPAATVLVEPCAGDTSTDRMWIYPSAGPGHTFKFSDCEGNLIGYGANRSNCASDCGC